MKNEIFEEGNDEIF